MSTLLATATAQGCEWIDCGCGNDSAFFGFVPSTPDGSVACPYTTHEGCQVPSWDGEHVVCGQCGNVFVQPPLETPADAVTTLTAVAQREPLSPDEWTHC